MPRLRKPEAPKACKQCGKPLERKRYNGRLEDLGVYLRRLYCDQACMGASKVKVDVSLAGLRKRAVKYRGTVCQQCGATDGLHVHHLDSDPANNTTSNLMTLCSSCHATWHWQHGKTLSKRQSVCTICGQPARKLDMCQKHYQRFKKYGDPYLSKRRIGLRYVLQDERLGPLAPARGNYRTSHPGRSRKVRPTTTQR